MTMPFPSSPFRHALGSDASEQRGRGKAEGHAARSAADDVGPAEPGGAAVLRAAVGRIGLALRGTHRGGAAGDDLDPHAAGAAGERGVARGHEVVADHGTLGALAGRDGRGAVREEALVGLAHGALTAGVDLDARAVDHGGHGADVAVGLDALRVALDHLDVVAAGGRVARVEGVVVGVVAGERRVGAVAVDQALVERAGVAVEAVLVARAELAADADVAPLRLGVTERRELALLGLPVARRDDARVGRLARVQARRRERHVAAVAGGLVAGVLRVRHAVVAEPHVHGVPVDVAEVGRAEAAVVGVAHADVLLDAHALAVVVRLADGPIERVARDGARVGVALDVPRHVVAHVDRAGVAVIDVGALMLLDDAGTEPARERLTALHLVGRDALAVGARAGLAGVGILGVAVGRREARQPDVVGGRLALDGRGRGVVVLVEVRVAVAGREEREHEQDALLHLDLSVGWPALRESGSGSCSRSSCLKDQYAQYTPAPASWR